MRLTLFPVEFLPNLRKDSAAFALPYYSMLKGVNDYYSGNFASCRNEVRAVFRSCYAQELLGRFDSLRLAAEWRLKGVSPDAFALNKQGENLESMKDLAGAGDKYRQAVAIAPDFAFASFALGEFYVRSGDSLRAVNSFQQAYQSDTLYLTAYSRCAVLYRQQGNDRSIIDVMTLALARGNDFWLTNFILGQAFMAVDDAASAEARYTRALELNPRCYETYIALGKAFQASKDFQKARDYFNRAIEIDALRREAVDALNKLNEQQLNAR
jgi:tetratricopeptide (TPR) repeat protein